jgi:hypothetical protein
MKNMFAKLAMWAVANFAKKCWAKNVLVVAK